MASYGEDLRAPEPETPLLPLDGVPHRPLAGQQRHQSSARSVAQGKSSRRRTLTGSTYWSRNRTRGWATADWDVSQRVSLNPPPRCNSRRWAMAFDMSTASSNSPFGTDGSRNEPDNWLRSPDPWEVARPNEKVEIGLNCSFELSGGQPARRTRTSVDSDWHPV